MSKNQRFYFFKIYKDFHHTPEHKYLRSQDNGVAYVYLYNIMCNMALETNGKLELHVNNEVFPLTDKDIAKEAAFPIDTVQMGIMHLHRAGLVEQLADGTFYLTKFEKIIGSETDSAQRMRRARKKVKDAVRYKLNKKKDDVLKLSANIPPHKL